MLFPTPILPITQKLYGTYLRKAAHFQIEADNEDIPCDPQNSPYRVLGVRRKQNVKMKTLSKVQINNRQRSINAALLESIKQGVAQRTFLG